MKVQTIGAAVHNYAGVHFCLAALFGLCVFLHRVACFRVAAFYRDGTVLDARTLRAAALIGWVAEHPWLAVAYVLLAVGSVALLQLRGRPRWTWWAVGLLYAAPSVVYWLPCAMVMVKLA